MKKKINKRNIYLLSLIKFKEDNEKADKICIDEKMNLKDKYVRKQLSYLSYNAKYEKELERLTKENINKYNLLKKKSEINIKKEIKKINKNHRILKAASNKMFLDIIFNNQKMKNIFFNTNNNNKLKYDTLETKKKIVSFSPQTSFKKCNVDNIQLIMNNYDSNNRLRKLKHSLSFISSNADNIKLKYFPPIKNSSIKNQKNAFKSNQNMIHVLKNKNKIFFDFDDIKKEKDEIEGMLTINYNHHKIKKKY
jgi:hypothetical protein